MASVMRIAIDTNCLVAALTKPGGSCAEIVRAWHEGRLDVVASEPTAWEAESVLGGGWLARIVGGDEVEALLASLRERTHWVESPPSIGGIRLKDEGDVRMVEAAVSGGASYIVTTDREFLAQRGHGDCEFVTPEEMLRRLEAAG